MQNILVDGVTFKDSPMWFCTCSLRKHTLNNVTVEGLGPNNDGFDPEVQEIFWLAIATSIPEMIA